VPLEEPMDRILNIADDPDDLLELLLTSHATS
jgi:hypothetical protein